MTGPGAFMAVAGRGLPGRRGLHLRVPVAEHDRAVAAHQVDVLVPVHVPDPRAPAAAHELRVGGAGGRLVPVHAARDHGPGALAQLPVGGAVTHEMCSFMLLLDPALIRPAAAGCVRSRKLSTWPRFSIPASEPRPVATRAPQARPSQAASIRAAAPSEQPGEQAGGEAVAAAGGVDHLDLEGGQVHGRAVPGPATRQPSAPQVTATAAVPSARTSLMAGPRSRAAGEGEQLVGVRQEPVRHGQQRGEPVEVLAGGRGAARRRRRARRGSWPPRRCPPGPRRSARRARPGRR